VTADMEITTPIPGALSEDTRCLESPRWERCWPDQMQLLSFRLPQFTSIMGVTEMAREVWLPRIQRVEQLFHELGRLAVADGAKPAAIQSATPEMLPDLTEWALRRGLMLIPVDLTANPSYSAYVQEPRPGETPALRTVLARPDVARELAEVVKRQDD